ncbi:MAG: PilZ domain-containing protein [Polyangiaceae bacterium]|nr:PilZ domain-containing protein [Polyangiaceae bacterium]
MEKRHFQRYRLWLPARIDAGAGQVQLAVGHDLSKGGVSLVTAEKLEVGVEVTVTFALPPDGAVERSVRARIVRVEANEDDPEGFWPFRVSVEFLVEDATVDELLREHPNLVEGRRDSGDGES